VRAARTGTARTGTARAGTARAWREVDPTRGFLHRPSQRLVTGAGETRPAHRSRPGHARHVAQCTKRECARRVQARGAQAVRAVRRAHGPACAWPGVRMARRAHGPACAWPGVRAARRARGATCSPQRFTSIARPSDWSPGPGRWSASSSRRPCRTGWVTAVLSGCGTCPGVTGRRTPGSRRHQSWWEASASPARCSDLHRVRRRDLPPAARHPALPPTPGRVRAQPGATGAGVRCAPAAVRGPGGRGGAEGPKSH
jgi:hypothetical protein